jgi:hypothetical protein
MRRIISSITLLAFIAIVISSCEKKDIPQDRSTLGTGSYVKLVSKNDGIIDATNPGGTKTTAKVSAYGEPQEKLVVYVSKGSRTPDRTQWKKVKEIPNSNNGEYTVEVSGTEISTAFGGAAVQPGELYTVYNSVITTDQKRFDFGNIELANVAASPNYNFALTFDAVVVCAFTGNMAGNYKVIRDDWVDWSPGDIVPVTDGPGVNQVNISQVWPNPAYGDIINPLYIIVTPATGAATVPNNYKWGDYGGIAATNGTGSGFVFSCTGDILMTIPTSYNGGNQGGLVLQLKKQ